MLSQAKANYCITMEVCLQRAEVENAKYRQAGDGYLALLIVHNTYS